MEILMKKIVLSNPNITYDCKSFKGIGGFTKKNTLKETKSGKLLNDLATYLRGFNKSLQHIRAAIIVVLDNDDRDIDAFRSELESVAVEAWLLGDEKALLAAYPLARMQVLKAYAQDSICGTWEVLADAVYPGGIIRFKRDCPTYIEVGKYKSERAQKIGKHMDLSFNKSPSFNYFMTEIEKRLPA